ncbi:hypothetical protein [Geminocystis sp. NIES-3709]|uniref:hypothetical protein n=1 Tax=Geminocystis sp. NIES-3709 TaxID=1617448 RepID=UPI0005FCB180|nr:hypothetical protein [Geminocystis sp. NIES-3709]BAQ67007.1 predicted protein [Geminocystis sp. NIES-3709]
MEVRLKNLEDGMLLWNNSSICTAHPRLKGSLAKVFSEYILPELGFSRQDIRSNLSLCLSTIPVIAFLNNGRRMLDLFSHSQNYPVRKTTLTYYRSVLIRFIDFLCMTLGDESLGFSSLSSIEEIQEKSKDNIESGENLLTIADAQKNSINLGNNPLTADSDENTVSLKDGIKSKDNSLTADSDENTVSLKGGIKSKDNSLTADSDENTVSLKGGIKSKDNPLSVASDENTVSLKDGIKSKDNSLSVASDENTVSLNDGIKSKDNSLSVASDENTVSLNDGTKLKDNSLSVASDEKKVSLEKFGISSRNSGSNNRGTGIKLNFNLISSQLKSEIENLLCFAQREEKRLSDCTVKSYLSIILYFLGWLHRCQGVSLSDVCLKDITNIIKLKGFVDWGYQERGNGLGWALNVISAAIFVARYYEQLSESVIDNISDLRQYLAQTREQYLHRNKPIEGKKELSLSQVLMVINYLRNCCASNVSDENTPNLMAQIKSWQRYLLISLLVYTPLRLSEIAEIKIDESIDLQKHLQEEGEDIFYLMVRIKGKRGSASSGVKRVKIPEFLSSDFGYWLNDLRPLVGEQSNFLFTKLGSYKHPSSRGKPLLLKDLSEMVTHEWNKSTEHLFGGAIPIKPQDLGRFNTGIQPNSTLSDIAEQIEKASRGSVKDSLLDPIISQLQQFPDKYKGLGSLGDILRQFENSIKR